jgi:hypothetical protein
MQQRNTALNNFAMLTINVQQVVLDNLYSQPEGAYHQVVTAVPTGCGSHTSILFRMTHACTVSPVVIQTSAPFHLGQDIQQ